jgi:hypothetical protein
MTRYVNNASGKDRCKNLLVIRPEIVRARQQAAILMLFSLDISKSLESHTSELEDFAAVINLLPAAEILTLKGIHVNK